MKASIANALLAVRSRVGVSENSTRPARRSISLAYVAANFARQIRSELADQQLKNLRAADRPDS